MRLRPGSSLWLLAHELRLAWRGLTERAGRSESRLWIKVVMFAVIWLFLHLAGLGLMRGASLESLGPVGTAIAGSVCLMVLGLVTSSAVVHAIAALFDRGDLDLLLSAPLPSERVFLVRGLGVAISSIALPAFLLVPFAHMGAVHGHVGLLATYPVFAAFGLGAAGFGLAATLLLVRWLGARRARVVAQILSAVLGAAVFLAWQLPNMLPRGERAQLMTRIESLFGASWLGPDSVLWWPLRALFGDPLPALAVVAGGGLLFVAVVRFTRKAFLAGTQEAASASTAVQSRDAVFSPRRGLARNIVAKELRLIARDPSLISQTLLQSLYIAPLLFLVWRQDSQIALLGPVLILMLAQVGGNLAWVTVAGEEAPDLLGSAPVDRGKVRWLKAVAASLPPAAVGLVVVLAYLVRSPRLALVFAVFLALALGAAAVVQVWTGKPSPHRDLKQRHKQNIGINTLEFFSVAGIAGAAFLAMLGSWWTVAPLALGLIAPAAAYAMRISDETT